MLYSDNGSQLCLSIRWLYSCYPYLPVFEKIYCSSAETCTVIYEASHCLGGIVPNLLRSPKAVPYQEILDSLRHVRQTFANKEIHVFGMGGTATLHLAILLGMDSVDSSGWRNRAARGIV